MIVRSRSFGVFHVRDECCEIPRHFPKLRRRKNIDAAECHGIREKVSLKLPSVIITHHHRCPVLLLGHAVSSHEIKTYFRSSQTL